MNKVSEMRDKAWRLLWKARWLNRFVFLIVTFSFIRYVAINLAVSLMGASDDALNERLMAATTPMEILDILREPPFLRSILLMMALAMFVATIINAVASYGLARIRLSVANGEEPANWQRMGFSGFSDPFSMFSLAILRTIFVWWPLLLFIAPSVAALTGRDIARGALQFTSITALPLFAISIVAFYRYRQAWFIKAKHNDWSALKCLRESSKMMVGHKWQCFRLDCSFWRPITLMLMTAFGASLLSLLGGPQFAVFISTLLVIAQNLYLDSYIPLGQAIFHLELAKSGDGEK